MKFLIVLASVISVGYGQYLAHHGNIAYARNPIVHTATSQQYHTQDEIGQYSYGYSGGPSAKQETRTADGITRGAYSYIDANGIVQHTQYISDPVNGFRVAATNLPVAPAAAPAQLPQIQFAPAVHNSYSQARVIQGQQYSATPVVQANYSPVVQNHYAPAPVIQTQYTQAVNPYVNTAPRVATVNYGGHSQVGYSPAPVVRQISAGFGGPVQHISGLPVPVDDTIEVKAAKAAHFRAYNDALARASF